MQLLAGAAAVCLGFCRALCMKTQNLKALFAQKKIV